MNTVLRFPRDLLRFIFWIYFKPISLRGYLDQIDPTINSALTLLKRGSRFDPERRSLILLVLFYVGLMPLLVGFGLGWVLTLFGWQANWLELSLYLTVGIVLCLSFSLAFCIAFLLPFSLAAAVFSSLGLTPFLGLFISFSLGLAYGLTEKPARWGLLGGLVYGLMLAVISSPLEGFLIGLVFWTGFFRLPFWLVETCLAVLLAGAAGRGSAARLWTWQAVNWDEWIWLPLIGLDQHLQALVDQKNPAAPAALALVRGSFRQGWAARRIRMD